MTALLTTVQIPQGMLLRLVGHWLLSYNLVEPNRMLIRERLPPALERASIRLVFSVSSWWLILLGVPDAMLLFRLASAVLPPPPPPPRVAFQELLLLLLLVMR